jgi:hypothetical protein
LSNAASAERPSPSFLARLAASRPAIPVLIAAVSILSSVISWRAALASNTAAGLEHQATRELLELAQRESELDRRVEQDIRILPRYEEHVRAWRLARRSRDAREEERARNELAVARALRPFFLGVGQSLGFGDAEGNVAYVRPFVIEQLHRLDQPLNELQSSASRPRADEADERALALVGTAALAIASLLLLTIARFTHRAVRTWSAGVGALVAAAALTLLVVIEAMA